MNVKPPPGHPIRPDAYRLLTVPQWLCIFEKYDPGVTKFPLEVRHPLIDLRLVNYLLSVPPVPWCIKKELLRVAMRGVLPETVRCRPKTPLAGDPVFEHLRHSKSPWAHGFDPTIKLTEYIDRSAVPDAAGTDDSDELWVNIRPLSLNFWLENFRPMSEVSGRISI